MRLIADPSNWDLTQHGISVGESGVPSSPHWKDQLDDWKAVTPRAFPFSEAAVCGSDETDFDVTIRLSRPNVRLHRRREPISRINKA
jgi:hypothetical protein